VYHPADFAVLHASHVIEFEHDWIGFTAIDTSVRGQIHVDEPSIVPSVSDLPLVTTDVMPPTICLVVLAAIDSLTILAIGRQEIRPKFSPTKILVVLSYSAFCTDFFHSHEDTLS
jgi:hypothetical protein